MTETTIGIFLKAPVPGRVKTRLCPPLTLTEAADLYTGMLADTLELALAAGAGHVLLLFDGPRPETYLAPGLMDALGDDWTSLAQRGEDLGARLDAACHDAAAAHRLPLLLLGSDSPDLPLRHVRVALDTLSQADLVLGPASDGGVWCIGVARPTMALFEEVPWSKSTTGADLGNRARRLGLKVVEVDAWHDVDEVDDLRALASRAVGAPHTRQALSRWERRRRSEGQNPIVEFEEE